MGLKTFINKIFGSNRKDIPVSLYDFKMKSLAGKEVDFSQYLGKNLLIVNTASKCGFTYQYEGLQKLHEQYSDRVTVLGFPANNFLWQEPGNNKNIEEFCQINYGVTFPMFEKVSVKGLNQHPLFTWLQMKSGKKPSWNFCKYLIDKSGNVTAFFDSKIEPLDKQITDKL